MEMLPGVNIILFQVVRSELYLQSSVHAWFEKCFVDSLKKERNVIQTNKSEWDAFT